MPSAAKSLGVATGLAASLFAFSLLFAGKTTKFEDAALVDTVSKFAVVDGARIHCMDLSDAEDCIAGVVRHPSQTRYLWLGNSQLHAINQHRKGDQTAPEALHISMRALGGYVVAFSEPNANLQEHLALFAYLLPRIKPNVLLLPVVFDDFRETGIRAGVAPALHDAATRSRLSEFPIGRELVAEVDQPSKDNDDFAGIAATVQERSERALTGWLDSHWSLWKARPEARGDMLLSLYELRNTAFGIKPTSTRKVIPARFARNWAALEAIVSIAHEAGVHAYLYVVPLRNDVKIPYDEREYAAFKDRLVREFGSRDGVTLLNLERIVANNLWGTKAATTVGGEPEYDFMHFRAEGHRALADALFRAIGDARMVKR